jgi:phosphate butyryltransferase
MGRKFLSSFAEIRDGLRPGARRVVSVAAAGDAEVIAAVALIVSSGLATPILVGDADKIRALAAAAGLPEGLRIVAATDDAAAARLAAKLVRDGEANVLMKGLVNTSDFLRAVLDRETGIRGDGILSHMAFFEVPGFERLQVQTDGGMNLYPTLAEKVKILDNALGAFHALGVEVPRVAAISANEQVNPKMISSVDAAALAKMNADGEIKGCLIEGPIALDVALSAEAARHKKIESRIAGETDLFLVPNIDAGNIQGKTLVCCAGAKMAGIVLGARAPIVLASRSDNAESKFHSAVLACAIAE